MKKIAPFILCLILFSCEKKKIEGCTDSLSTNYNSNAEIDDGSCKFAYPQGQGLIEIGSEVDLNNEYDVYIDGFYIGRSTLYFPDGLSCENPQSIGALFDAGQHTVRAVGNGGSDIREGIVHLSNQECIVVLIENLN